MNDILSKVTPLTRGIIWLHQGEPNPASLTYQSLDYLFNGLLTATLGTRPEASSRVMLTTNFHSPLHVFFVSSFVPDEYESFMKLLKKDLGSENTVLVIDECDAFNTVLGHTPKELKSILHQLK